MENSKLLELVEGVQKNAESSDNLFQAGFSLGASSINLRMLLNLPFDELTLDEKRKATELARANYEMHDRIAKKYGWVEVIQVSYEGYQTIKERCR